jgi:simple sugar transport system substrate-binding protein
VSIGNVGAQDPLVFTMISHGGEDNPLWDVIIKGMEDACTLLDADCEWIAAPITDVAAMTSLWDDALARDNDGIGTTAPNPDIIRDGIARAVDADIPVVVFNTPDPNANTLDALPTLFYIGASDFQGGRANAQAVIRAANTAGISITKGICPIHEEDNSGLEARCAGVRSVFEEMGIPLDTPAVSHDIDETADILTDYFASNPSANAAFMLGTNQASALNQYFQENDIAPNTIFATSHDTSAEVYQMINDGYLLQTIDQQPYLQGFETIMRLYLNSQFGLSPASDILTGPEVIDQNNVDALIDLTQDGYR